MFNRLIQSKLVSEVKQDGQKVVTDHFVFSFLYNRSNDLNYAIHIRKRFGKAVERNRAKRVFRASLYHLREMIYGVNIIITPRRGAKGLGSSEVTFLLEKCFSDTGIAQER